MAELQTAFSIAHLDAEMRPDLADADLKSLAVVESAATALLAALEALELPHRAKSMGALLCRMPPPPGSQLAQYDFVRGGSYEEAIERPLRCRLDLARCEVAALALAGHEAAEALVGHEKLKDTRRTSVLPKGWIFLRKFAPIFEKFIGQRATFSPETATGQRSACIRFIQEAYVAFGKEPPLDTDIISANKRMKKAIGPRRPEPSGRGP